jgi:precorrin-6B methylase 2
MNRVLSACSLALILIGTLVTPALAQPAQGPLRVPDVVYVPTPHEVVNAMLTLARVGPGDVVFDLGSGDGRIPIAAVRDFGAARATGVDIDPQRIQEATASLEASGLGDRVRFLNQDLFETDISEATVVTLYLLPSLNLKLLPKFRAELRPGTRIVSHAFDMGDWAPEQTVDVNGRFIYIWTIPPR